MSARRTRESALPMAGGNRLCIAFVNEAGNVKMLLCHNCLVAQALKCVFLLRGPMCPIVIIHPLSPRKRIATMTSCDNKISLNHLEAGYYPSHLHPL